MKINYLKKLFMTVLAVICFSSLIAQPAQVFLIGGPLNKNNPNWLLNQKVELTKDQNNPSIFYFKGYLAYNWRGDERGNLKFLIGDTWGGAFHPNTADNQLLTAATPVRQDGADTKWFIPADRTGDGYYELTLNTQAQTLTVDSFRQDLKPERIYAVGSSMPCGWNNTNPMVLTRTNPTVAVYTWSGIMSSGDFKFLTPMSIGNWDYCYDATTANEAVTYGVAQNVALEVRNSDQTSFNDYKFIMNETADCTITVNLVNNTMTVTKNGELYAQDIWIQGTAIPGGKAKLVSDNIDPLVNYHYFGELLQGDFKFTTTENINTTTQFYVPTSTADAISSNIDVNQTINATTPGWTVSQTNPMSKIKLNTLTNKYKGSVFGVENIYIVGGATAVGWDSGNSIELTRGSGNQSHIYTFDGNLTIATSGGDPNKFKFLLQRNWGPSSYHAQFENESITNAQFFTDRSSDDYKWTIDADKQGRYVIVIDALNETIDATYYSSTPTGVSKATDSETKIFSSNGKIVATAVTQSPKTIEVFASDGTRLTKKAFTQNTEIDLSAGIYIVRVSTANSTTITKKISVLK